VGGAVIVIKTNTVLYSTDEVADYNMSFATAVITPANKALVSN